MQYCGEYCVPNCINCVYGEIIKKDENDIMNSDIFCKLQNQQFKAENACDDFKCLNSILGTFIHKKDLQEYLNYAIRRWRKRRDEAENEEDKLIAMCYVDAFQSVRVSFFNELLPIEEENKDIKGF